MTSHVALIEVPYDSGRRDYRMGRGPARISAGLRASLANRAFTQQIVELDDTDSRTEAGAAIELARKIAACVRDALVAEQFPLLLAGNCSASLGMLAGLGSPSVVAWFDAHADFNTPDTTVSGFFDGMSVATLTGRCWRQLAAQVNGFAPLADEQLVLIGTRDIDPAEADLLQDSSVSVLTSNTIRRLSILDAMAPALAAMHSITSDMYLHIDLDVLDPGEGRANHFASANGLTMKQLLTALRRIGEQFDVRGATLSAYEPESDSDGRIAEAAVVIAETVFQFARG